MAKKRKTRRHKSKFGSRTVERKTETVVGDVSQTVEEGITEEIPKDHIFTESDKKNPEGGIISDESQKLMMAGDNAHTISKEIIEDAEPMVDIVKEKIKEDLHLQEEKSDDTAKMEIKYDPENPGETKVITNEKYDELVKEHGEKIKKDNEDLQKEKEDEGSGEEMEEMVADLYTENELESDEKLDELSVEFVDEDAKLGDINVTAMDVDTEKLQEELELSPEHAKYIKETLDDMGKKEKKKVKNPMAIRVEKELKKEKRIARKRKIKEFFTSPSTYGYFTVFLDFTLNAASIVALGFTALWTVKYLIEQNPIMVAMGCLVMWVLVKINEKIQ